MSFNYLSYLRVVIGHRRTVIPTRPPCGEGATATEYRHGDVIDQVAREIMDDLTNEKAAAMAAGDTAGPGPYDLPGPQGPRDVSGYLDDD